MIHAPAPIARKTKIFLILSSAVQHGGSYFSALVFPAHSSSICVGGRSARTPPAPVFYQLKTAQAPVHKCSTLGDQSCALTDLIKLLNILAIGSDLFSLMPAYTQRPRLAAETRMEQGDHELASVIGHWWTAANQPGYEYY